MRITTALAAVLLALGSPALAQDADAAALIAGDWRIVDQAGEVLTDCAEAQHFEVSADGRFVDLTELGNDEWSSRYVVLHREPTRVLMFIEGEERQTSSGDPVLWWAYFDGPDSFRWSRYDWRPHSMTDARWQRCGEDGE